MQSFNTQLNPFALLARNINISSPDGAEIIALENIPFSGFRNVGVTVYNHAGSTTTAAKLYGSSDGVRYAAISSFSLTSIAADSTKHAEIAAVFRFLRVTLDASSGGAVSADVYLDATP